jgi:adenosylcobinamide-GDP ribazoletransferase
MRSFFSALQFLTICPFVGRVTCDERHLGRSALWFPLIGLLAGGMAAGVDQLAVPLFGPALSGVFAVVALLAVSGGLHADGLADTGDGFFSSRPPEQILEIMRDSRIGTMGLLAVMIVFTLKCAALVSLPAASRWQVLLLMGLAGRCGLVLQLSALPYARKDGGLCSVFVKHRRKTDPWIALVTLVAGGWFIGEIMGLSAAVISVCVLLVFLVWCHRKIGGFTGDTLGGGCEILELVPALVAVIFWKAGAP